MKTTVAGRRACWTRRPRIWQLFWKARTSTGASCGTVRDVQQLRLQLQLQLQLQRQRQPFQPLRHHPERVSTPTTCPRDCSTSTREHLKVRHNRQHSVSPWCLTPCKRHELKDVCGDPHTHIPTQRHLVRDVDHHSPDPNSRSPGCSTPGVTSGVCAISAVSCTASRRPFCPHCSPCRAAARCSHMIACCQTTHSIHTAHTVHSARNCTSTSLTPTATAALSRRRVLSSLTPIRWRRKRHSAHKNQRKHTH